MRGKRLKLGDIYEIPLPNGYNAYGRLYKEYNLAIYEGTFSSFEELPNKEHYRFFLGVYRDLLQDKVWKVVGNRPFADDEEAWPPPECVVDAITRVGSIYHKGEIRTCTYDECKDLEVCAAWDRPQVIDRIMGGEEWKKYFRWPINPDKQ